MAPYISLDTKSKKEILQYYSKNYESYLARGILPIMPQRDAIFHYFSINGDCSHKDIQKSLRSRESASVDANGRRSRESASVDANGRRNRVSTASQLGIHIIGSEKCPYTIKAEKLLRTRGTPFTKEYYDSIGEALQNTGTKTIPAIYNSGILIGGYDDLHSLLKKS